MLSLPFFDERHRALAAEVSAFAAAEIEPRAAQADAGDPDAAARQFLRSFADAGFLRLLVPSSFAASPQATSSTSYVAVESRSICLAREAFAAASGLADAVFAVHGLGGYAIAHAGADELKRRYLPRVASGDWIAAFALTEAGAGSDLSAIQTSARVEGDVCVLNGAKTLISNAGIADFFVVFARTDASDLPKTTSNAAPPAVRPQPAGGTKAKLSAFVVDASTPGVRVEAPIPLSAPHSIAGITFENCRVPLASRLGGPADGMRIALATLDFFRPTVAAAAAGLAARALRETRAHTVRRRQFDTRLADFQGTRFALADMQVELDAARLLVYRAAWTKDAGASRTSLEGSAAKLFATEAAQRIVDRAVQLHGGRGVVRGEVVERLYREVRALRIYEGASEIQRLIIADQMLKDA